MNNEWKIDNKKTISIKYNVKDKVKLLWWEEWYVFQVIICGTWILYNVWDGKDSYGTYEEWQIEWISDAKYIWFNIYK